jgi:hypothetical protein
MMRVNDYLLQGLLKMKLSSGKLQFWECKKPFVDAETFYSSPIYWYFTFLHAGNVFRAQVQ